MASDKKQDAAEGKWMIRPEFDAHMLNDAGKAKAIEIAGRFSALLESLEEIVGADSREMVVGADSREMALVRTNLQNASFYAKRAMAMQPANQQKQRA